MKEIADEDIYNEINLKIKKLEEKNEELRKKIKQKQNTLAKDSKNKAEKKEKIEIITLENDRKAAQSFEKELKFLHNNYTQIFENLEEYDFEFKPKNKYGTMYILGDFNGWKPELMQKNENGFWFKVVLIKGFKFYYSFMTYDEILLDYNSPYEENKLNSKIQNYIEIYQEDNEKTTIFDYKEDLNILKVAQRNFLLLKIEDNVDESIFLEKFKRHVINSKNNSYSKENLLDDINSYFDEYLFNINDIVKDKFSKLQFYFKNHILVQNSQIIREVQYQYQIISLSEEGDSFIGIRLYDHNQIKLNSEYYKNVNNCWKIPFSKIVSSPITKRDKLYHLLPSKESQQILDDYNKDDENIIIAYFNDLEELNKNSRFKRYRKANNIADMVLPKKIEPNDVEMKDYDYHFLNNEIIHVINKVDDSHVEYKVIEENKKFKKEDKPQKIYKKEEENLQSPKITYKENKAFNKNTFEEKPKKEIIKKKEIKPAQFIVYYTISNNNKIIILHCHILDKSFKYKKMIIKNIEKNEDPHILKKDKLYINSNELLLITKASGPIKLYFKGKKVQMKTILISPEKIYRLKSIDEYKSVFHDSFVFVKPVKDPFKLNNEIAEKCKENIYTGKEILNGLDVKIEYNESFGDDMNLAVAPCLLVELSAEEEYLLKNKPKKETKKEKKSYEMQKLDLIEKEMVKYRKYTKEVIQKMKTSEKDDIATTLDDYKSTMDMICNYVQEKELWDYIEKVSIITNEIENLLNLFDNIVY